MTTIKKFPNYSFNIIFLYFLVFPKYSITRSFCRTLLTEAYRDLLLPRQHKTTQSSLASTEECLKVFANVRDISRKTNGFIMDDIQVRIIIIIIPINNYY